MNCFKNFLQKIFPPTANGLRREVERVLEGQSQINQRNQDFYDGLKACLTHGMQLQNDGFSALEIQLSLQFQKNNQLLEEMNLLKEQLEVFFENVTHYHQSQMEYWDSLEITAQIQVLQQSLDGHAGFLARQNTENLQAACREIHQIQQSLDGHAGFLARQNTENLQAACREIHQIQQSLDGHAGFLANQNSVCQAGVTAMQVGLQEPLFVWNDEFERRYIQSNWDDVWAQEDFAEKYLRLISGMDKESVQSVTRILSRVHKIYHAKTGSQDFFSKKEKSEMQALRDDFDKNRITLSENMFAYQHYLLSKDQFEPSVFYYKHGIGDLTHPDSVAGKSIIDVGGFIGDSVLVLEELCPDKIYTFEAVPSNFETMQQTFELNGIQNVVAENVALGKEKGTIQIHTAGSCSNVVGNTWLEYSDVIDVPVITLDEYVEEHDIQVGLIKVDIEGAEPQFLEGAKRTICKQKPTLLLSIYHNSHDFLQLKPLIESWNLGYQFKIHKPTFTCAVLETLLLAEVVEP